MNSKLLFLYLVCAVAVMASCSSDSSENTTPVTPAHAAIPLSFSATIDKGSSSANATRAITSDDVEGKSYDRLRAYWAPDDQVTMMLDHNSNLTFSTASFTQISEDSVKATFQTTLDGNAAVGDNVTAFFPTLSGDGTLNLDYSQQDGSVESLAKLDPTTGSAPLAKADPTGAVLTHDIGMATPIVVDYGDKSFGSAYYGVKLVKKVTVYKIASTNTENCKVTVTGRTVTSETTEPIKVKKLTFSARAKGDVDNGWCVKTEFNPKTKTLRSYADYTDDSIVVVPKDGATTGRIYLAMPAANNKITATISAQDENGYVWTVDKVIPAKPGTYYPITLEMKEAEYVDMGGGDNWATHNVGAEDPADYGDYFAWGETYPKCYYYWLPELYRQYYGNYYMYTWGGTSTSDIMGAPTFTKYYDGDKKFRLDDEDDAATANWGSEWRMPSAGEIWRLCNTARYTSSTNETRVNTYGEEIKGVRITSRATGNSIFLPFGGQYSSGTLYDENMGAYYWGKEIYRSGGTSENDGDIPDGERLPSDPSGWQLASDYGALLATSNDPSTLQDFGVGGGGFRFYGRLVRPIRATVNVTHIKK